jgi:hypothetical protein
VETLPGGKPSQTISGRPSHMTGIAVHLHY